MSGLQPNTDHKEQSGEFIKAIPVEKSYVKNIKGRRSGSDESLVIMGSIRAGGLIWPN